MHAVAEWEGREGREGWVGGWAGDVEEREGRVGGRRAEGEKERE